MRKSYFLILFLALAGILFFPQSAFSIRIDNAKFEIEILPGDTYNGSITVENYSEEEAPVKVYLEDFLYTSPFDGAKEFYAAGTTDFSLQEWITFSPQEFLLKPYSRQKINFIIRAPQAIEHLHCGVLFFETSLGQTYEAGQAINILGRVGSLIFIEPEGYTKVAEFSNLQGKDYSLSGEFLNSGSSFIHSTGTFYVMDGKGIVSDRGEVKEVYLLPQDEALREIGLSKDLGAGNYDVIFTFDLGGGDVLVKEVEFLLSADGAVSISRVKD